MVALLLALVLAGGHDGAKALAWADRLYPQGIANRYDLEQALEAYRRVATRFPQNRAAWLGQGRCLQVCGWYPEARRCFLRAGAAGAADEAGVRARIVANLDKRFKPLTAVQIERVPRRRDEWIGLLTKRKLGNGKDGMDYEPTTFADPIVVFVRAVPGRAPVVL